MGQNYQSRALRHDDCPQTLMILDHLSNAKKYEASHPLFPKAFDFLRRADLAALTEGKHVIDGKNLYASVDIMNGRGHRGAKLEVHRNYIDIQYTLSGHEEIGWKNLSACKISKGIFDTEKDIAFFGDQPSCWLSVPAGHFAIFFPEDAHAPLGGAGRLHKVIMKIRADR